jgi:UDP-glucose 4-epimerase
MKVLITGGAGFIGSQIASKLLSQGEQVDIVDDLSTGILENIAPGASFFHLDISDHSSMFTVFKENYDAVVNMAAIINTKVINTDPQRFIKVNISAPVMLMQMSLEARVKKFINASSMAIYANSKVRRMTEEALPCPITPYGWGKLMMEYYSKMISSSNMQVINARLFNVYGPHQNMENVSNGFFRMFFNMVYHRQPVISRGPLERFRDFVYIDDVVNAISSLLAKPICDHETYNICSGEKTTIRQLLSLMIKGLGMDPNTYPVTVEKQQADDIWGMCGDYSRLNNEFGWKPKVNIRQGVKETIKWCRQT